jgi:hypothetical protein
MLRLSSRFAGASAAALCGHSRGRLLKLTGPAIAAHAHPIGTLQQHGGRAFSSTDAEKLKRLMELTDEESTLLIPKEEGHRRTDNRSEKQKSADHEEKIQAGRDYIRNVNGCYEENDVILEKSGHADDKVRKGFHAAWVSHLGKFALVYRLSDFVKGKGE